MSQSTTHPNKTAYITLGVMLGAAAGVMAGMLAAPRSGADTRSRIRTKAMDAKNVAAEKMSKSLERTKHAAGSVADRASSRAKRASDKARSDAENMNSELY
jgi:gas vesicle protein